MAINLKTAKPSPRHAGVYLLPDGRLVARAVVRLEDGKVKTLLRTLPAGSSEADAVQVVETLKSEARNPPQAIPTPHPQATSQTVEDYCERWLKIRKSRLKPSAAKTYEIALSKHILPRIGGLQVSEVNRQCVETWVVWAEEQEKVWERRTKVIGPDGRKKTVVEKVVEPYSHDTLKQWWRVLSVVLKDMAADLGFADPTSRVRPPERPQAELKREQRTVDTDLLYDLLVAAKKRAPDRFAEIACLALTGMRAGELYGLKWDTINFDKCEIIVKRSVSRGVLTETTKTKAQRTVPLHPILLDLLKDHREQMIRDQHGGLASNLVFPTANGKLRSAHSLDRAFENIAEELGMDINLGAQVLRRSLNSNLLRQQVDRLTIRSIMGHTTEEMTARYYGAGPAEKMAAVLALPTKPKP